MTQIAGPRVSAGKFLLFSSFVGTPILPVALYGGAKVVKQIREGLFAQMPVGCSAPTGDAVVALPTGFAAGGELLRGGGPATPSGVVFARLRPRARWVRALEAVLGGRKGIVARFCGRRWTPDLPETDRAGIQNYLLGSVEGGVRFLGGGTVIADSEEGAKPDLVYFIVDTGDSEGSVIFPYLLGSLRTYALYRKRDSLLLGALRTRAQGWCKGMGLAPHIMDLAVAGATSMAMMPSRHEQLACARAREAVQKAAHLAPPLLT